MQIRLGHELVYDCPQPPPMLMLMLMMLNIHHTRVLDIVVPDHLVSTPPPSVRGYHDGFGNWCSRIA